MDAYLGEVDPATVSKAVTKAVRTRDVLTENTHLSSIINLNDFEHVAKQSLSPNAWAYYSSGSDDEISKQMNRKAFQNISLRSRVLRNVEEINTSTMILGQKTSMPVFVSPAAMAKLAHPLGECAIASGVGKEGLIQVVSTSSSMSIEDIMSARVEKEQPVFFQLYVNRDINKSKALIRRTEQAGVKAIWITVDSAVIGKREQDERIRAKVTVGIVGEFDEPELTVSGRRERWCHQSRTRSHGHREDYGCHHNAQAKLGGFALDSRDYESTVGHQRHPVCRGCNSCV